MRGGGTKIEFEKKFSRYDLYYLLLILVLSALFSGWTDRLTLSSDTFGYLKQTSPIRVTLKIGVHIYKDAGTKRGRF